MGKKKRMILVEGATTKETVVFLPYLRPDGSYLSPANSWKRSKGILGFTGATDITGALLKADAKTLKSWWTKAM